MPRSRFNKIILRVAWTLLMVMAGWTFWYGPRYMSVSETSSFVFLLADVGFVFSLSILGFLIAGFSIFASVTKPELFITLANISYDGTEINRLQFVFFNFLNVFSVYLVLLALSMIVQLVFSPSSPAMLLGQHIVDGYPILGFATNAMMLLAFGVLFVEAFLKLKSFIWNLYQTVLVSIATEDEIREKELLEKK